jgi:hypothetical protein
MISEHTRLSHGNTFFPVYTVPYGIRPFQQLKARQKRGGSNTLRRHYQTVFPIVRVVAVTQTYLVETVLIVEFLGGNIGDTHLEGNNIGVQLGGELYD